MGSPAFPLPGGANAVPTGAVHLAGRHPTAPSLAVVEGCRAPIGAIP